MVVRSLFLPYLICSAVALATCVANKYFSSVHASALQVVTMMMAATDGRSMPHNENYIHISKRSPVNPLSAPIGLIGPPLGVFFGGVFKGLGGASNTFGVGAAKLFKTYIPKIALVG